MNNQQIIEKNSKKTPLGIISIVLSIICFALVFLPCINMAVNRMSLNGTLLISFIIGIIFGIVSTILSIADIHTGKGSKNLSQIALCIVWIPLAICLINYLKYITNGEAI